MGKLILFLSFIGISILFLLGLVAPNNPIMWGASTSINFAALRALLLFVLFVLLVTRPPRNIFVRTIIGILSISLTIWVLDATYNSQMKLIDTLSLLPVAIAAGIDVLERTVI